MGKNTKIDRMGLLVVKETGLVGHGAQSVPLGTQLMGVNDRSRHQLRKGMAVAPL